MNLKYIKYRQKNKILLLGSAIAFGLIYLVSLSPTWALYQTNKKLELQVETLKNAPVTIRDMEKQLSWYEGILKTFSSDTLRREEYLLDQITNSCKRNSLRLVLLPVSQFSDQEDFRIETRIIKIKGRFVNLLRTVHEVEHQFMVGRVSSVRFSAEEDRKNNSIDLFAYIYIQNLSVRKNETR